MRVVLLIVDGLRPDAITPASMPALHDFAARWWRTTARTVSPSVTVPALTSLATGVAPATHGVLEPGLQTLGKVGGLRPLPAELKRHGRATAVVLTDLPGSHRLVARSMLSLAGVQAVVWGGRAPAAVADTAVQVVARSRAACTILYFNDCDRAGHAHGWMSAPYLDAARRVDDGVAALAQHVEAEEDVALLVVADHGGGGLVPDDHDGAHPLNEAIPLVAGGAGLPRARTCAAPASLLDVAPTILHLLDVPVPATYEGRVLRSLVERVVVAA